MIMVLQLGQFMNQKIVDALSWCFNKVMVDDDRVGRVATSPLVLTSDSSVMRPFPPFGFHQMYTDSGPLPLDDEFHGLVAAYAERMGIDALWLISQMYKSPPEDMNILGNQETESDRICRRWIATGGQGPGSSVC